MPVEKKFVVYDSVDREMRFHEQEHSAAEDFEENMRELMAQNTFGEKVFLLEIVKQADIKIVSVINGGDEFEPG